MGAAMIHSETRSLLTDALTPPPGCSFDSGVATTFSLDLVTLLGLPLHLAWLGHAQGQADEPDPIAAIEALRRTAGQLTIFCQRGRMQIPRVASPLLGLLEGMVHEVTAPHGGAFHPKVWLLKFVSSSGAACLRLLVLSRNLTDDGSWDVSLCLDGAVGRKSLGANKPLRALLAKTIECSHKRLEEARTNTVQRLMDEMMRCEWELPPEFQEMRFHALGVGREPEGWLPAPDTGKWDDLGVISPFVAETVLSRLASLSTSAPFLISRGEELDALPSTAVAPYESVWIMDERAESSDKEEAVPGRERGLHAKVFVGKRGWNTHLFVGSANASNAALLAGKNVEFMSELIGKASKAGRPRDWLGDEGIRPLLARYTRTEPNDAAEDLLHEKRLEEVRVRLCAAALTLHCEAHENGWTVDMAGMDRVDTGQVQASAWPVTVRSDTAVDLASKEPVVRLGVYAIQDITSFIGFKLVSGKHELCFALALPLHGAPEHREVEMLRAVLRNRDGFVRYLLLLLGDWVDGSGGVDGIGNGKSGRFGVGAPPLFEMLAKAYARDPQRLLHVSQVIARLQKENAGQDDDILPPEFMDIWQCFEGAADQQDGK
jgi:hypothetical protein